LVTTKGTSVGLRSGLSGTLVPLPLFTDPVKKCVNVQTIWDDLAGVKMGRLAEEVYFNPVNQNLVEAMDGLTINMQGEIYGPVTALTAFVAGTELLAA